MAEVTGYWLYKCPKDHHAEVVEAELHWWVQCREPLCWKGPHCDDEATAVRTWNELMETPMRLEFAHEAARKLDRWVGAVNSQPCSMDDMHKAHSVFCSKCWHNPCVCEGSQEAIHGEGE